MSLILDALRRRSPDRGASGAPKTARADALLATLGYPRRQGRSAPPLRKLALYGAGAILLGFVGLALLVTLLAPPTPPNQNTLAQRSVGSPGPAGVPTAAPRPIENLRLPPAGPSESPGADSPPEPPQPRVTPGDPPAATRTKRALPPSSLPVGSDPATLAAQPSTAPASPAPAQPPVDDFGRALFHQRFGDYASASSRYADVVTKNGPNAVVRNNEGVMFIDMGQPVGAITQLMEALSLDPKYVKAQNNLGVAFLNAGRLDEATKALHMALAQDPRNVESMVNLALVHKAAGRLADARDLLQRAVAVEPRVAGAHYNLAVVADEAGDAAVAAEHYRAFLRLDSGQYANLIAAVRARLSALGR